MSGIPQHIVDRQLQHFTKADADYGRQVAEKLRNPR
jgi:catalase